MARASDALPEKAKREIFRARRLVRRLRSSRLYCGPLSVENDSPICSVESKGSSLYNPLRCASSFNDLFHHYQDKSNLYKQLQSFYFNFSSFEQEITYLFEMESYVAPTQTTSPVNARGSTGQCIVM
ncbi:uncharacterized protein MCYG_03853 [Microsporum canis CBS 113480]|uniref:Uncharacterized protein n=1 Tax=Arthroderma otae (strain ATCC MYA-4605 / CBS 113480) TaxID=554155 RepID=C5FMD1_ARTOC|nr:uncharacterized protein MCYG_03853 [Microsporum canis CBS 113480]EEQ31034.1 predicted protein [Microsporum canis CBS 113480]